MIESAASRNDLSKTDVVKLRLRLLALRAELEARRSGRDLLQLKRVETALVKIARGGYGTCEACARPMAASRLLEAPHARYCAVCSGRRTVGAAAL